MSLFKRGWESKDRGKREAAVAKLTDQRLLVELALNGQFWDVRAAAARKVVDPAALAHIIQNDPDSDVRAAAFTNLGDANVLAGLAANARAEVRKAAVDKLTDQRILVDLALRSEFLDVRWDAVYKVKEPTAMAHIIENTSVPAIRDAVFDRLSDLDVLLGLATSANAEVRHGAVRSLKDQEVRADLALTSEFPDVREVAAGVVYEPALRARIIENTSEPAVRDAAFDGLRDLDVLANLATSADAEVRDEAVRRRAALVEEREAKRVAAEERPSVVAQAVSDLLRLFGDDPGPEDFREQVRAIGEMLDERYSMSGMREVGMAFAAKMPQDARWLETMWDGIGYWMG
ncbi:MAG: hypothetical protein LBG60_09780 [Bifidobacteriaceae bacterium]|jgi:hypothetical protein|nr:hypothetical protein [Bifidobacteriaceae bacterium]